MITNRIPGGNIEVVSVNGRNVELDVELRDTAGDWFYWCFQAVFPEAGNWHFRFVRDSKVGTHGPAVSLDGGKSWRWLYPEYRENSREFDYACPAAGQTVLFCMGMQYLERDFSSSGSSRRIRLCMPGRSAEAGRGAKWSLSRSAKGSRSTPFC